MSLMWYLVSGVRQHGFIPVSRHRFEVVTGPVVFAEIGNINSQNEKNWGLENVQSPCFELNLGNMVIRECEGLTLLWWC